jgi:hypothetical protein
MFDPMRWARNLRRQATNTRAWRQLPMNQRRSGFGTAVGTGSAVVIGAAAAAVTGLLLWDAKRRAAMGRRLQDVTRSVKTNADRAASHANEMVAGARSD